MADARILFNAVIEKHLITIVHILIHASITDNQPFEFGIVNVQSRTEWSLTRREKLGLQALLRIQPLVTKLFQEFNLQQALSKEPSNASVSV